ncbi:hypothetical protein JFU03_09120 [Bacillus sp. TH44]|nr:hypothetical protein [Bacillus sp. TH44]
MITLQTKYKWDMSRFFMHACAFLLLLEWLRPLIGITNVGRLDIFVIFIGICFTLSFSNKVADSNKDRHDLIHHSFPVL